MLILKKGSPTIVDLNFVLKWQHTTWYIANTFISSLVVRATEKIVDDENAIIGKGCSNENANGCSFFVWNLSESGIIMSDWGKCFKHF